MLKMARQKIENHYKDLFLSKMTFIVAALRNGTFVTPEWSLERKFAVMEVTAHLADLADQTRDSLLQSTIRCWIGHIQQTEGIA